MEVEPEQKQKRTEGGDSPDPKRSRVVGTDPSDTEMWIEGSEDPERSTRKEEEEEEEGSEGQEMEDYYRYDDDEVEGDGGICVPPSLTEEEKAKIDLEAEEERIAQASYSEFLIRNYGTDDREAIAFIVEIKQDAYAAKYPPKLPYYDDDYEEPKLDDEEVERINKILNHVDQQTRPFSGVLFPGDLPSDLNLFLLDPWVDADCTPRNKNGTARTLDMYYKRFFPCVKSACSMIRSYAWNRVPEVDAQYLSLYSKICGLVKPDERSWISFFNSTPENRNEYKIKAQGMAKLSNLNRLKECDITACLREVFKEGDIIAEHKLKLEYDMFLLDSIYTGLRRDNFKPREHTPVFENIVFFNAASQQSKFDLWWEKMKVLKATKKFDLWWEKMKVLKATKDQCKKELNALHEKNLNEYCGTRIHYLKFKRAWAKKLGIISEETC